MNNLYNSEVDFDGSLSILYKNGLNLNELNKYSHNCFFSMLTNKYGPNFLFNFLKSNPEFEFENINHQDLNGNTLLHHLSLCSSDYNKNIHLLLEIFIKKGLFFIYFFILYYCLFYFI